MEEFFERTGDNDFTIKVSDIVEQNGGDKSYGFINHMRSADVKITVKPPVKRVEMDCKRNWIYTENSNKKTTINYKYYNVNGYNGYESFLSGKIYIDQISDFEISIVFVKRDGALQIYENRSFAFIPRWNLNEITEKTEVREIQCVVCAENKIQLMFENCRHFCLCFKCQYFLENCPICRKTSKCVRVYLP